ncbi:hypothetical protein CLV59_104385 [Chitinophaga dinghuensis]|uniref:Uncharacterized protein n=1 Tax=Chitinophaga dinghuensis TaxID=1539050 RepID=A0A327W1A7_9BACT|nr:hypothetical protein CLV59_104385 [Chitinophaga dinghuensis]
MVQKLLSLFHCRKKQKPSIWRAFAFDELYMFIARRRISIINGQETDGYQGAKDQKDKYCPE